MTQGRKLNRLRYLEYRIERTKGKKKFLLEQEHSRVLRSLGVMVWVAKAPNPVKHMGVPVEEPSIIKVDGTYKH